MTELVLLGYVVKAFGIKGGVGVKLFNPDSQALRSGAKFVLRLAKLPELSVQIDKVLDGNRVFFSGISDRTKAESLVGSEILIARSELPDIRDDEYYLCDLIGMKVWVGSDCVAQVVGFSSNNAQTLLELSMLAGYQVSVPLVDSIVKKIDLEKRLIVLDPPIGLLDQMD
jgi:16S rRNA processing protein RimM